MTQPPSTSCSVVTFINANAGMADGMLRRHVDDGTGHCAGCSWQQKARPTYPCLIHHYATLARALGERSRDRDDHARDVHERGSSKIKLR